MAKNETAPAAHLQKETGRIQTIQEHSVNTAALAGSFSIEPLRDTVYASAMLHDVGKYQSSFQKRIKEDSSIRAPHALCGAQAAHVTYPRGLSRLIMEYVIAGHHAGLPDYGSASDSSADPTLCGTLRRSAEDYSAYKAELAPPPVDETALYTFFAQSCISREDAPEIFAFFTRYCFSCLTDADSLDTEAFETGCRREALTADFAACLRRVNDKINGFRAETPLQKARASLQGQAFAHVEYPAEIYLMNMPTGSGKTLCSLKFALERAIRSNKKRIIYVIPYNSIIDQTAQVFEQLLGNSAVILRHQSTWIYEDDRSLSEEEKLARTKATENWDAPIIITTVVQFFESMYGDRRSRLRKLHNMQDAVLVFDEAHLLPRDYLQPCLKGIALLVKTLRSEAVLLTATMPDYPALLAKYAMPGLRIADLVPDRRDFGAFYKCRYQTLGALSDETLLLRAAEAPSCLLIVNNRKAARKLYAACPAKRKYHLSTWMTALDRQRVIRDVRAALASLEERYPGLRGVPREERLTVISTSLVEAGVDFDFHTVYRELTGLDSILQSGGRCNREGKRITADVYVFERAENEGAPSADARVNITRGLLARYASIDTPECIKLYYEQLYAAHENELTRRSIVAFATENECYDRRNPARLPLRSYAQAFRMIDAPSCAVAVPCDDSSRALIARIPFGLNAKERRKLQLYECSVTPADFRRLLEQHRVSTDASGMSWLAWEADYNPETGIRFECSDIYC